MSGFLLFLILSEVLLPSLTYASRVRRQTTKVRISAVGNTITLKFLQPDKDLKLEGYILGYGSSLFSKQLIQLPDDGEPYETEIDAEPKYLVAVQPVKEEEVKKQCIGKETLGKPLHLVIGSVTPTSVMLSWGTLLNTLSTETNLNDCIEDGHYTVRYREKEPKKTWNYKTCPTRETVIDQLKPDTPYEFGVRAESKNISGAWSPPVRHNTAVKEIDIHTPLKPKNILNKPITESTQTFSPLVPVTQNRPAFLLKHPQPPPTQTETQAKDIDKHKPLKPENPLRIMKPITKSPQTFSSSVSVLISVTQSTPASLVRHLEPPPTQRATQDINKPLRPEIFLRPAKLLTESTQAFSPSVSVVSSQTFDLQHPKSLSTQREILVLHSVTKSRPAFLLKHPASSPVPRVTLGTGSNGLRTSRPSEESIFLTQTLASTHTPLCNLKSPNILQTHYSTKPTLLITTKQSLYSTQSQTVSSTVKAQLNVTQKKRTKLHNNSSATKFSTTRIQEKTAKYPIRTTKPKTRPPKLCSIYPKTSINHSQHSTTKSQLKMTQIRFTTVKPSATQSQPHAAQPQSFITQSQLDITHPKVITTQSPPHTIKLKSITTQTPPHTIQIKSIATQSPPQTIQLKSITTQTQFYNTHPIPIATQSPPNTTQTQSITTQSQIIYPKPIEPQSPRHTTKSQTNTVKYYPSTDQTQPTTILPQPHTMQSQPNRIQPKLKKNQPITKGRTTKPQTKTMQPKLPTNNSKTKMKQPKPRPQQSYTLQPQSISTQTSTANSQDNFRSHQQPVMNPQHNYVIKPKFTPKPNTYYQFSTPLESLSTTEFQQQPDYYPTSATIKLSNTKTWQHGKTELTHKSKPKQHVQTLSEKSNTQNTPWGEKKPVNKKIPVSQMAPSQSIDGHQTKPVLVRAATNRNQGQDVSSPLASVASTSTSTITKRVSPVSVPNPIELPPTYLNISVKNPQVTHDEKHKGQLWNKRHKWNKKKPESNKIKNQLNQVDKIKDKATDLKVVDALPIVKPSTPTTEIYRKPTPTTTPFFAYNGSRFNMGDNSSVFSSVPISDLDPMGKKRFVAPHVVYQIDKPPEQPCSVTHSLSFFPDEDNNVTNITGPPRTPPTNLTVVTVEGCPSFVILDWETADNETKEYEVTSSVKSPNGHVVSVVKTNQTHTAVENLKPESSYEFTVTPKNELGSGPSSESVSFCTESADPRVSEIPTGKNAIWSSFTFDADSYSECTGTQYVKRTWYRKFVGIQLCNSLRYKIYLSDSLKGKFYDIGDETGYGEDHCQFVDSFLDGRTGSLLPPHELPPKQGYFRAMRQEPVKFGKIGGSTQINYVGWYECGVPIPGSW